MRCDEPAHMAGGSAVGPCKVMRPGCVAPQKPSMRVRFFGVRGSTPTPGPSTVRYGGNTVCVEVRLADGSLVILDAGTGIRELGAELMREEHRGPISLVLTHVHWDHIQGLPFFAPLWQQGNRIQIFPMATPEQRRAVEQLILFDGIHFPVHARDIPATIDTMQSEETSFRVGSATIRRMRLNHPGGSQGFRIDDADGRSIAYLTDNELSAEGPDAPTRIDDLARFADGCDVVIHDAQYLEQDMPAKKGWGHSVVSDVLELGRLSATKHLVLFHHAPERDDDALDAIGKRADAWLAEHAPRAKSTVAHEGLKLDL